MKQPRLLLLGSGDSGKTTFLKQIKVLHGGGFTDKERRSYIDQISNNLFDSMGEFLRAVIEYELELSPNAQTSSQILSTFFRISKVSGEITINYPKLTKGIATHMDTVWKDPYIQTLFNNTAHYKLFFNRIFDIAEDDYLPSENDIIFSRSNTTNISETTILIEKVAYHFYDVGGQQQYRKQWIPYFDNVNTIVFVASLASFDQFLIEDSTINRMHDALDLYDQICNHVLLKHIPITLLLNKKDLFEKKFPTSNIQQFFPDYNGRRETDVKKAITYFQKKFLSQNTCPDKTVLCHITCCTNTTTMRTLIETVLQRMVTSQLKKSGLIV
ncbi:hypothetical protein BSLG_008749 [Batrachochytrium salamandrivorans]|nr:hypothetical protein BSLG_008749 [Batrachochytrium salamandrivorans]